LLEAAAAVGALEAAALGPEDTELLTEPLEVEDQLNLL